jgi:hypothetical protein
LVDVRGCYGKSGVNLGDEGEEKQKGNDPEAIRKEVKSAFTLIQKNRPPNVFRGQWEVGVKRGH